MINVKDYLTLKLSGLTASLPAVLAENGIGDFDKYTIGYPTDQDKTFCCVRFAEGTRTPEKESIVFTVHLQLPGVSETDAYKYIDAVKRHITGSDICENITVAMTDNFRSSTVEIFFEVTVSHPLTSCNYL